jgi:hypothetical protein
VVVIGERHAERIKRPNDDLPISLGNLHFKLGHYPPLELLAFFSPTTFCHAQSFEIGQTAA